jgi:hypothetical protein
MTVPWAPGAATSIGSLPGDDPAEAAALVFGELPELPHLAELPARGAGADIVGRSAAMLVDLPVELTSSGWRITAHDGRDVRRARDFLSRDLDAVQTAAEDYVGPYKVQALGPWTLAATLELANGHKVVSDHGAARDLADSLAEGLTAHLAMIAARVPGAVPVLQLDEPALPSVLGGRVPTPSGWGTVRSVDPATVRQQLQRVLAVSEPGARVVHCCAADVPIALLREAGADALSVDGSLLSAAQYDPVGEALDGGVALWLGVLPSTDATITLDTARDPIDRLWAALGFARSELARRVVPTPACGLANASAAYVRSAFSVLRDTGSWLRDQQ